MKGKRTVSRRIILQYFNGLFLACDSSLYITFLFFEGNDAASEMGKACLRKSDIHRNELE